MIMHEKIIVMLVTMMLALVASPVVAEAPALKLDDFAFGADLGPAETEFRRFSLAPIMMKDIQRRDLGDVRVFNDDNELVISKVRKKDAGLKISRQVLSFSRFTAAGKTAGYILDRKKNYKSWLKSLSLSWQQGASPKILALSVEHSADKKKWKVLKESEIVNNYTFNGIELKQNVIDINGHTERYLKLTFINTRYSPVLASAHAYTTNKLPAELSWITAGSLEALDDDDNSYRFSVSKGVSPDYLRLSFGKLNTLLHGSLYTVDDTNGKLERKEVIKNFSAYRVTLNNKVVNSRPINLKRWQSVDWLVTVNDASNLDVDDPPDVMVAYPQYEVIFANDGSKQYTVVWGNSSAGAPESGDIVKRLKAGKITMKDIAVIKPGRTLDKAELTELMNSRWWANVLMITGLVLLVIAVIAGAFFGYRRYQAR
jgi:hypothetical protein